MPKKPRVTMDSATKCRFKSSQIYNIIKYPVISLQLATVYVPQLCVCRHDVSDTEDHLETRNKAFYEAARNTDDIDSQSQAPRATTEHPGICSPARMGERTEESCSRRLFRLCSELFAHKIPDTGGEKPDKAGNSNSDHESGDENCTRRQQDGKNDSWGGGIIENDMVEVHQGYQLRKSRSASSDSRSVLPDTQNVPADTRNVPADTRNVPADGQIAQAEPWSVPTDTVLSCDDSAAAGMSSGNGRFHELIRTHEDSVPWKVFKALQCAVFFLLRLADVCRCAFVTVQAYGDDTAFVYSLTQLINISYCLLLYAATCHSCTQDMPAFLEAWFQYERKYGLHPSAEEFGKTSKKALILFTLLQAVQSLGNIISTFYNYDVLRAQLWPFFERDGTTRIYGILMVALTSYLEFSILIGSSYFLYVVLRMLRMEFARQREELTSIFQNAPEGNTEQRFENVLERMRALSGLKDRTYDIIKHTVALVYICVVPYLCCITYGLVSGCTKNDQYILVIFSVLISMALLTSTTLNCGYVYTEARSVWNVVYLFPWYRLTSSMMLKVSVFVNQLIVENLGITVYGVFQVDRSTFLTMGGAIITYIVIVVQFQLDPGSKLDNGSQLDNGSLRCCTPRNVTD